MEPGLGASPDNSSSSTGVNQALPLLANVPAIDASVDDQVALETIVVILLAVLPDAYRAMVSYLSGGLSSRFGFEYFAFSLIVRSVQISAVVLYLMSRSQRKLAGFGVARFRARYIPMGIGFWIVVWCCSWTFWRILSHETPAIYKNLMHDYHVPVYPIVGVGEILLLIVAQLANGFAEELAMRAYLITRFEQMFGTRLVPLLFSAALFACYHIYQGWTGFVSAALIGIVFGLMFIRWRVLWPIALAHAFFDIASYLKYTFR